jgi:hypothetical protein
MQPLPARVLREPRRAGQGRLCPPRADRPTFAGRRSRGCGGPDFDEISRVALALRAGPTLQNARFRERKSLTALPKRAQKLCASTRRLAARERPEIDPRYLRPLMYVTAIAAQTPTVERRLISSAIWLISMRIMPTPLGNASPSAVDSHATKKPSRILAVCVTVLRWTPVQTYRQLDRSDFNEKTGRRPKTGRVGSSRNASDGKRVSEAIPAGLLLKS